MNLLCKYRSQNFNWTIQVEFFDKLKLFRLYKKYVKKYKKKYKKNQNI